MGLGLSQDGRHERVKRRRFSIFFSHWLTPTVICQPIGFQLRCKISVKQGVIVVSLPNAEAQVLQFPLNDYWPLLLDRLKAYWNLQSSPLSEKALKAIRDEY